MQSRRAFHCVRGLPWGWVRVCRHLWNLRKHPNCWLHLCCLDQRTGVFTFFSPVELNEWLCALKLLWLDWNWVCSVMTKSTNQVVGTCVLYNEAFSDYLANCQLLSGPPDVSGCAVNDPEENSCAGMRWEWVWSSKINNKATVEKLPNLGKASVCNEVTFKKSLHRWGK